MNRDAGHFDPVLEKNEEKNTSSKNAILSHGVLLCVLVARKNTKLSIWQIWKKNLHKTAYPVWTFMAFKWNDQGDDHIHCIVYYNVPKLDI